jgi:hypothetical protein
MEQARGFASVRHVRPDSHVRTGDLVQQRRSGELRARAAGGYPCLGPGHPERRLAERAAGKAANSKLAIWT